MNLRLFLVASAILALGVASGVAYVLNRDTYRGPNTPPSMPNAETLKAFADKRIFFGHQSVGYNILDGLSAMAPEFVAAGLPPPNIKEITSIDEIAGPGVYHARAGRNVDPLSKIAAFEEILVRRGFGTKVDVALLKFCYVDFPEGVEPSAVIDAYMAAIDHIKAAYPRLTIVHATCPLTAHTWGLKSHLRVLIKGDGANLRRNMYNDVLRSRLVESDSVFDIAAAESTRPDGTREQFNAGGTARRALFRGYTYDNGHLNADGARRAAIAFVEAVAGAN